MLDLDALVRKNREKILELATKYGAYNVRIFGSVARGDYNENSDIDFLVDFKPGVSLLDWSALWVDLEDLLGHKVDLGSEKSLKARIKDKVLSEAVPL